MFKIGFVGIFLSAVLLLQQTADEVLLKVQEKFNSIDNFTADFVELNTSVKGDFFFKKENQFKIITSKRKIISDGLTIWNYEKKLNRVVINNIENEQSSFSLQQYLFEYPPKCDKKVLEINDKIKVLEFIPREDELGFKSAKIYIDENYLVNKIELISEINQGINFEFKNIKLNIELSNKSFEFIPPQGSRIIDLR